jgi:hypothetical protein
VLLIANRASRSSPAPASDGVTETTAEPSAVAVEAEVGAEDAVRAELEERVRRLDTSRRKLLMEVDSQVSEFPSPLCLLALPRCELRVRARRASELLEARAHWTTRIDAIRINKCISPVRGLLIPTCWVRYGRAWRSSGSSARRRYWRRALRTKRRSP